MMISLKRTLTLRSFSFLVLLFGNAFAGSDSGTVLLYNDSPTTLTAVVQASNGELFGEVTLGPNEQKNFTASLGAKDGNSLGNPQGSLTPYTVTWQCEGNGIYSMCTGVSPGAMVRANDCPGNRFCPKNKAPTHSEM